MVIGNKAVTFASPARLVGHYPHRYDVAELVSLKEVEEVQVVPLIWQVEDEQVGARGSLLVLSLCYAVESFTLA